MAAPLWLDRDDPRDHYSAAKRRVAPPVLAGWYVTCRRYSRGGWSYSRVRGPFESQDAAERERQHWLESHRGERFELQLVRPAKAVDPTTLALPLRPPGR